MKKPGLTTMSVIALALVLSIFGVISACSNTATNDSTISQTEPYRVSIATEMVPYEYTTLSMALTVDTPEYTNKSNWKVKLISFDATGAKLESGYGDVLVPFSIAFNEGEWTGGEGTAKLVVRNDPDKPWVEVWVHNP